MRYDYNCPNCKTEKTVYRPMAEDDPGYTCDKCNTPVVRDYNNSAGFIASPGMYSYDNRKK